MVIKTNKTLFLHTFSVYIEAIIRRLRWQLFDKFILLKIIKFVYFNINYMLKVYNYFYV